MFCLHPDGKTTTNPPEIPHPELWITVSLLLLIITVSLCGLVLFLRFRRAQWRRSKPEDHDVTMLKVPQGDDPTYGVRDSSDLTRENGFFCVLTCGYFLPLSSGYF